MIFEKQKKILFMGDSVTESERRTRFVPFGNGYVSNVRNTLIARYPELNPVIVNRGVAGNTIREMGARWDTDVMPEKPDYLSVSAGVNDIYRQFIGDPRTAVYPEEFQTTYRTLLRRTRDAFGTRIILISPYYIEPNKALPMRRQFDAYNLIVAALAKEFSAVYIDMQAVFDAALKVTTPQFWSADQFHPNGPGAALITETFLNATGFAL